MHVNSCMKKERNNDCVCHDNDNGMLLHIATTCDNADCKTIATTQNVKNDLATDDSKNNNDADTHLINNNGMVSNLQKNKRIANA